MRTRESAACCSKLPGVSAFSSHMHFGAPSLPVKINVFPTSLLAGRQGRCGGKYQVSMTGAGTNCTGTKVSRCCLVRLCSISAVVPQTVHTHPLKALLYLSDKLERRSLFWFSSREEQTRQPHAKYLSELLLWQALLALELQSI